MLSSRVPASTEEHARRSMGMDENEKPGKKQDDEQDTSGQNDQASEKRRQEKLRQLEEEKRGNQPQ
jgi:hypothetical protein